MNDDLLKYFVDDFKSYSTAGFENMEENSRRTLLDLLCACRVYIAKRFETRIADVMQNTAQEYPPWPDRDRSDPNLDGDKNFDEDGNCQHLERERMEFGNGNTERNNSSQIYSRRTSWKEIVTAVQQPTILNVSSCCS